MIFNGLLKLLGHGLPTPGVAEHNNFLILFFLPIFSFVFSGSHRHNGYQEDRRLPVNGSGESAPNDGGDHRQRPRPWPHWPDLLAVHQWRPGTQTQVREWLTGSGSNKQWCIGEQRILRPQKSSSVNPIHLRCTIGSENKNNGTKPTNRIACTQSSLAAGVDLQQFETVQPRSKCRSRSLNCTVTGPQLCRKANKEKPCKWLVKMCRTLVETVESRCERWGAARLICPINPGTLPLSSC